MDWSYIAVQRLKDYESRKEALTNIREKIKILEEQFTSIRSATTDETPVQGSGSRREDMLIANITKREELAVNYTLAKREVALTERGLAVLSDEEKLILERFFINKERDHIERLCEELYISKTELYRRKDRAIRKFTIASYGIVEL
jgi:hypothetical protein